MKLLGERTTRAMNFCWRNEVMLCCLSESNYIVVIHLQKIWNEIQSTPIPFCCNAYTYRPFTFYVPLKYHFQCELPNIFFYWNTLNMTPKPPFYCCSISKCNMRKNTHQNNNKKECNRKTILRLKNHFFHTEKKCSILSAIYYHKNLIIIKLLKYFIIILHLKCKTVSCKSRLRLF